MKAHLGFVWRICLAVILSAFPSLLVYLLIVDSDLMYSLPIHFGGHLIFASIASIIAFAVLMFILVWDWIMRR